MSPWWASAWAHFAGVTSHFPSSVLGSLPSASSQALPPTVLEPKGTPVLTHSISRSTDPEVQKGKDAKRDLDPGL